MLTSALRTLAVCAFLTALPALAQSPSPAVPSPPSAPPSAPVAKPAAPSPAAAVPKDSAKPAEKSVLIDLNTATVEELSALKGIGEVRSAAIVKGRPYKGKDELVQKKIIPDSVYADIKDRIIARQKAP